MDHDYNTYSNANKYGQPTMTMRMEYGYQLQTNGI